MYQQREQENNWYSQKKTVFKLPWSKMRKQIDVKLKITRRWLYMKVRYIAFDCTDLTKRNIYECLGQEYDCYRIIDESGEDYLYPISEFEVVEQ